MMYGCIGERLTHSFSAEIHALISREPYALTELSPASLSPFLARRDFAGINVTIPYKQAVIPALDEISPDAKRIGAVNTIVNREGRLWGYNTDLDGLTALIRRIGVDLKGKRVLILGTGGTSRTAACAAQALGALVIERVSRSAREGAISYEEAAKRADTAVIINTTPCGMYPHADDQPLSLDPFPRLEGVVDVVYNPLRTRLVLDAKGRDIPAAGGLYMLVRQAVRSAALFRGTQYPDALTEDIYRRLLQEKSNLVLIGMPGSGKTALSAALGQRLSRPVVDTDQWVEAESGMKIRDIFRQYGEACFRNWESRAIRSLADRTGIVIATGGGAVLRQENVDCLRRNGRLLWLDRRPDELTPTQDRPLADTRDKILQLYRERLPLYQAAADRRVDMQGDISTITTEIESGWRDELAGD